MREAADGLPLFANDAPKSGLPKCYFLDIRILEASQRTQVVYRSKTAGADEQIYILEKQESAPKLTPRSAFAAHVVGD